MDSCTYLKGAHIKTAKPSVHCNEQQVSVVQVKTSPPVKAQHLKEKKMLKKKKKASSWSSVEASSLLLFIVGSLI